MELFYLMVKSTNGGKFPIFGQKVAKKYNKSPNFEVVGGEKIGCEYSDIETVFEYSRVFTSANNIQIVRMRMYDRKCETNGSQVIDEINLMNGK